MCECMAEGVCVCAYVYMSVCVYMCMCVRVSARLHACISSKLSGGKVVLEWKKHKI